MPREANQRIGLRDTPNVPFDARDGIMRPIEVVLVYAVSHRKKPRSKRQVPYKKRGRKNGRRDLVEPFPDEPSLPTAAEEEPLELLCRDCKKAKITLNGFYCDACRAKQVDALQRKLDVKECQGCGTTLYPFENTYCPTCQVKAWQMCEDCGKQKKTENGIFCDTCRAKASDDVMERMRVRVCPACGTALTPSDFEMCPECEDCFSNDVKNPGKKLY